jgi:hypothetical protein
VRKLSGKLVILVTSDDSSARGPNMLSIKSAFNRIGVVNDDDDDDDDDDEDDC